VTPLILCVIAAIASLCLTKLTCWGALCVGAIDQPADRKVHHSPVPRLGGVAVVGAMGATLLVASLTGLLPHGLITGTSPLRGALLVGGVIIFLCGVWDDLSPISARTKLLAQLVAAGLAVWFGVSLDRVALTGDHVLELGILSVPLTLLWIVGVTNAFNLIDGLDGLAAGLGSIAAGTCAAIFLYVGAIDDAMVLCMLLGALLGFLPYNFNPAKIFLGDSGSLILGYLLSVMVITGTQKRATATAVVIPLLTLGIPIIDTLLSMVRRMLSDHYREPRKYRFWKNGVLILKQILIADRDHIHHRLMARGFSHRGAVWVLYAAATALSSLALLSALANYGNSVLLLLAVGMATAIGIAKLGYLGNGASRFGSILQQVDSPKFNRTFFFGFADLLLVALAYWGAYALLLGKNGAPSAFQWYFNMFPVVALVQLSVFWVGGLYRGLWRAVGVGDLMRVAIAVSVGGALSFSLVAINRPPLEGELFVVYTLALGWLMCGMRSAYRLVDHAQFFGVVAARQAFIYGAGLGGRLLLRELRQNAAQGFHAVGFIDDDPSLQGRLVSGIPVLGTGQELEILFPEYRIQALLVSSRTIIGPLLKKTLMLCEENGIGVFRSDYFIQPISLERAEGSRSERSRTGQDRIRELHRLRSDIASLRKTAS
jgi:UDP-GlcNAc:undecaprenyl-phosphate/decaprenyl-phosphate GlcNAc-1-phosphate transferase